MSYAQANRPATGCLRRSTGSRTNSSASAIKANSLSRGGQAAIESIHEENASMRSIPAGCALSSFPRTDGSATVRVRVFKAPAAVCLFSIESGGMKT